MGINATRLFSVMYHRTLNVGRVVSPILIHKAAKKAFDAFGLKKLPTVRSLNEEFARLMQRKRRPTPSTTGRRSGCGSC